MVIMRKRGVRTARTSAANDGVAASACADGCASMLPCQTLRTNLSRTSISARLVEGLAGTLDDWEDATPPPNN